MWEYLIQLITAIAAIAGLLFAYLNYRMQHPRISIAIKETHYELMNDGKNTVLIRAIFTIDNYSNVSTSLKSVTCSLVLRIDGSYVTIPPDQGRFPMTIGEKPTTLLEHSFAFKEEIIKDISDLQLCKNQNALKTVFSFETKEKRIIVKDCIKPKANLH